MRWPNFIIIGAAKSGTTALYHYLKQHPQIYTSPVKEPRFLICEGRAPTFVGPGDGVRNRRAVTTLAGYQALFQGASTQTALGEASTGYLHDPEGNGAERIHHYLPDAKLIVILRNPAQRAYSNYLNLLCDGDEPLQDFALALEAESVRLRNHWSYFWGYKRNGFYHNQLKPYFERFSRNQLRVYLYEDLVADATGMLRDVFGFLGVDAAFTPDVSTRYNESGVPRSRALHDFIRKPHLLKSVLRRLFPLGARRKLASAVYRRNLRKPEMPAELRRQLLREYEPDILKLQDLIGRDLSCWLVETAGEGRGRA
jgi:hypothetical protein